MDKLKKIIVTGSNKGIGLAIVQNIVKKNKYHVIMACRNINLAQQAKKILMQKTPKAIISLLQLDISDQNSIEQAAKTVQNKYGKIDILLNNAGINSPIDQINFKINFYGTVKMCMTFLPIIQNKGKIINVTSNLGTFNYTLQSYQLKKKFDNPKITKQQLFDLINQFASDVKDNSFEQKGWKNNIYISYAISKLGINIYTRILAREKQVLNRQIQIYSLSPGYVKTDMTNHKGDLTVEQGALTPVYLVQLQHKMDDKLQGQFFYLNEVKNL